MLSDGASSALCSDLDGPGQPAPDHGSGPPDVGSSGGPPCLAGHGGVAGGDPLENIANNSSASARKARYNRRSGLWNITTLPRCRACGRRVRSADGMVGVRVTEGHAGFAGLVSCGSVWVCPVCSSKVMARRALEIGAAVAGAAAKGIPVAFMTLTMRHRKNQRLADLWDALAHAWKRTTGGRAWVAERERFGVWGVVRVVEVTYGENGWHVHVHALVFGEDITAGTLDTLGNGMWSRWSKGLQSMGLDAPLPVASEWHIVGGDLEGTAIGEYLAKGAKGAGAIGMELTQTQSKVARTVHGTQPVWTILDQAVTGETAPLRLWHEWEKGSKGRRQIAWSKGLRERLGLLVDEQTDEEIAAEELGRKDDTVVWITRHGWAHMVRYSDLIPDVLTVAEQLGQDGLSEWLHHHGIDHRRA